MMILAVESIGPLGEPLLSKRQILSDPALRQPDKVPAPRVRMADQDQRHSFSLPERQGRFRLEQTFLVTCFDNSHEDYRSMGMRS